MNLTQEVIERLAKEAGGEEYGPRTWSMTFKRDALHRFGDLIANFCESYLASSLEGRQEAAVTLLPCPFCGNEPELYTVCNEDGAELEFMFRCEECGIEKTAEWRHEAIAAWNRRALPTPVAAAPDPSIEDLKMENSALLSVLKAVDAVGMINPTGSKKVDGVRLAVRWQIDKAEALTTPAKPAIEECASEGCGKPAAVHFIRGNVGSHYCPGCYLRIHAGETERLAALSAASSSYRDCPNMTPVVVGKDDEGYRCAVCGKSYTADALPAKPAMELVEARAEDEWHEDDGYAVWWTWSDGDWLGEPSYIGSPLCDDWPGYHTHWTPHPAFPAALQAPATPDAQTGYGAASAAEVKS